MQKLCCVCTIQQPLPVWIIVTSLPTHTSINSHPFLVGIVSVHWGRGPVVLDLSQSDCVENCHMRKEHLTTVCNKLWPRMRHLFEGSKNSIQCENRYNTHFETGMIVLLYRMSWPWHLHPEMEQSLKMRKSKLSSIIHTFSAALYKFATPFLNGAILWQH